MLQLFKKKSAQLLGIDVGTSSVRLIELANTPAGWQIENYGIEYFSEGIVVDADIKNIDVVGQAIERLVRRCKPNSIEAAVAVPSSGIIIKLVQFPADIKENEIEEQLEIEAERHIPFALDEVSMDFEVQGISNSDSDSLDVLLVAARSHLVDARAEALELGGLRCKVVDTEVYAIERAYELIEPKLFAEIEEAERAELICAVIDIGGMVTTLNVIQDKKIIYNREANFGSKQLIESMCQHYECDEAEAYKTLVNGSLPEDYHEEVFMPYSDMIAQQISRSIQMFFSASGHRLVDQIVLSGGSAGIDVICAQLQEDLKVQCAIANPIEDMIIDSRARRNDVLADASGLMIACGLALRKGG